MAYTYKSIHSVAEGLRRKWGVEMDFFQIASNCKDVMIEQRIVPLIKKLDIQTVTDFRVELGDNVHKVLEVFATEAQSPVLTSGSIVIGDILFPPQTFWVSTEQSSVSSLTTEELEQINQIPYIRGPYVDFKYEPPNLKFNYTDFEVGVVYSGVAVDNEGYVLVPEDYVDALINYCAHIFMRPQFLLGKIPMGIYQEIKADMERSFANGRNNRMMRSMSQNEMDKLLNIMTSMDRKHFNINQ